MMKIIQLLLKVNPFVGHITNFDIPIDISQINGSYIVLINIRNYVVIP